MKRIIHWNSLLSSSNIEQNINDYDHGLIIGIQMTRFKELSQNKG